MVLVIPADPTANRTDPALPKKNDEKAQATFPLTAVLQGGKKIPSPAKVATKRSTGGET